ncbi:MAG: BrnT family toxin [candidate division NC10 bacterium]
MPEFEFDPRKSASNREKHGIDFIEVQALWNDERLLEVPVRSEDEPRFLVIGTIAAKLWAVFITYRGERVRIISARRARVEEIQRYEG